jgi:hypothetical protein
MKILLNSLYKEVLKMLHYPATEGVSSSPPFLTNHYPQIMVDWERVADVK